MSACSWGLCSGPLGPATGFPFTSWWSEPCPCGFAGKAGHTATHCLLTTALAASERASFLGKIITGGQTGVDRAALDAALDNRFPCGGYCPKGRRAEDGMIHARYPLQEHASKDYARRTLENVLQAHGTLIIHPLELKGGTALTAQYCHRHKKPLMLVDAQRYTVEQAARATLDFIQEFEVEVLNVAGPRSSQWDGGYPYTYRCIESIIKAGL